MSFRFASGLRRLENARPVRVAASADIAGQALDFFECISIDTVPIPRLMSALPGDFDLQFLDRYQPAGPLSLLARGS